MTMTWGALEKKYVCSFINLLSPPCLPWQVLGSLQPDALMDYLRISQLKTQVHDCGYLAGSSQVPVKVGMLAKRALSMLYVIHTYEWCSGYQLTRHTSSPIPVTSSGSTHEPSTSSPSSPIPVTSLSSTYEPSTPSPSPPILNARVTSVPLPVGWITRYDEKCVFLRPISLPVLIPRFA